jgi:hypothetical protein
MLSLPWFLSSCAIDKTALWQKARMFCPVWILRAVRALRCYQQLVIALLPTFTPCMSDIAFPGHPSSSSQHDEGLYRLTFDSMPTSGFQMNPQSAHPPRTPRTSVMTSGTTPFNSQVDSNKEEPEDHPADVEVEPDVDEEESQERAATKSQIHVQDICREFVKTSSGRDKAFVLYFASSATTLTDCLWLLVIYRK